MRNINSSDTPRYSSRHSPWVAALAFFDHSNPIDFGAAVLFNLTMLIDDFSTINSIK
jgi:hypothetical protein